ncbi:reverse transcriptase domain-containing protein, partial [Tanacetum coccineum]
VRSASSYNGIIGRRGIRKIQAVPSTAHGMLKFPVEGGVLTIRSSKIVTIECASVARPIGQPSAINQVNEERIKGGRDKLCDLLRCNLDVFAWKPADITGVPRNITEHRLNIREGCPPIRQKKRGQAADRNQAIKEEVEKLVDAGIMKEVHYHGWLSNPVMVESLCGFPFKCFLDAYKGYHQIKMAKEDEEKTSFITSQGIYCYSKMPFGLRNTRATYQRLVDKAFHKQIGRNLENTKGNQYEVEPQKCTFGVEEGMFLGYKVNTRGLKVCPDKVDAVLSLTSPKCLKDVQKLNGKLASLKRFLAKSAEKSLPFFKTLKGCTKKSDFCWTDEAESSFRQMKHIAKLPMLTALEEKEELIVYLVTARETASKRLRRYFQAHLIIVITDQPINQVLSKPEVADGSRAGLILTSQEGMGFTYALRFGFEATNNEAEYEALIAGLRIAEQMGIKNLQENIDSRLVANQVPRSENKKADALSKIASTSFAHLSKQVLVEELKEKLINEVEVLAVVEEVGETWMTPIHEYLTKGILPAETDRARDVRRKSQWFAIINGILYKKSFLGSWLRCVGPLQVNYVLREIHEGSCNMHGGTRFVRFASVKHPHTNGLVERANRSLGEGIKARLDIRSKDWMGELSHVLWAHRTMLKSSNEDTPFSLTYGTEAVIPAEIGMPTLRTAEVDVVRNDEALEINLDLLEERREQAAIREAKSKRKMEKYYNAKVRSTSFKPGDLVYRNNDASHTEDGGKLGPK